MSNATPPVFQQDPDQALEPRSEPSSDESVEQSRTYPNRSDEGLPSEESTQTPSSWLDPFKALLPRSPGSIQSDLQYGSDLRRDTEQAFARGDDQLASDLLVAQDAEAFRSILEVTLEGGDPFSQTIPSAAFIDPQIEAKRKMIALARMELDVDRAMQESEWGSVKQFRDSNMALYKESNAAKLIEWKEGMSQEEQIAFMRQLKPVEVDPNAVADMRQRLVKLNAAMKKINPRLSVFTHPKTRDVAMWLNRESSPYQAGYIKSGGQPHDYGAGMRIPFIPMPEWGKQALGYTANLGLSAWEGITGLSYHAVEGTSALAMMGIDKITNGRTEDYWNIPTNAVVDHTGEIVHNGGKVNPEVGIQLNLWNMIANDKIQEQLASDANAWETAEREGFNWLTMGIAHLGGSLIGFGPAAKAWTGGSNLAMKGAALLGSSAEKMTKMRRVLINTTGAAIAGGTIDGISFGKHEGFAKAFTHGVIATPLYLGLGALGRSRELAMRKKMPKRVAQAIAGGMEGAGLGVMEINNLTPLWHFMKDPTEENWKAYGATMLKNILGMALIKGGGRGLPTPDRMAEQVGLVSELEKAIPEVSREAATTKDPARREELLKAGEQEGWAREDMLELGEMAERQAVSRGTYPQESQRIRGEMEQKLGEATRRKEGVDEPMGQKRERAWQLRKQIREEKNPARQEELEEQLYKVESEIANAERGPEVLSRKRRPPPESELPPERLQERGEEGPSRLAEGEGEEILSNRSFPASGTPAHAERQGDAGPMTKVDLKLRMEGRDPRKGVFGIGAREGDPIRLPMRFKGFRGSGMRGYLETRQGLARSAEAYDLNNMAHEWNHEMQRKTVGFKVSGLEQVFDSQGLRELMDIGVAMQKPGMTRSAKLAEGWAEFFSRDWLGDPELRADYPALYDQAMGWLSSPENRAVKRQYDWIKDGYEQWRTQGDVLRAHSEIMGKPGTFKTETMKAVEPGFREKVETFMDKLVDDAAGFRRAYEKWMKLAGQEPKKVSILYRPADMYAALKMTAPRVAESMLMNGVIDLSTGKRREGVVSVFSALATLEPGKETKDWAAFTKREKELEMMDQGLETGVSRDEALRVADKLRNPKFEAINDAIRDHFHGVVDYVTEAGGFSMEQGLAIKEAYQVYIPFHRILSMEAPSRAVGRPIAEQGTGVERMRGGGGEPILDPAVAIAQMTTAMVVRAQKAMVVRSLHDHHLLHDEQGGFVTDVSRDIIPREVRVEDIARSLDEMNIKGDKKHELETMADLLRTIADGNFETLTTFAQATTPRKGTAIAHTVHYTPERIGDLIQEKSRQLEFKGIEGKEFDAKMNDFKARLSKADGTLKWLELDPEAYGLMMGVDGGPSIIEQLPWVLAAPAKGFATSVRMGATILSPMFALRNTARDAQQTALYTEKGGAYPILSELRGLYDGIRSPKEMKELLEGLGGAGISFIGHEVSGEAVRKGEGQFAEAARRGVVVAGRKMLRGLADTIGESEQWLRRREFKAVRERVLKEGGTEFAANMEGLLAAKEISVNFTRGTSWIRAVNQLWPYFGASVQGTRKWVRALYGAEGSALRRQAWTRGLTHLTALSALQYLWHGQEDWFRDLPEWQRMNYWNFKAFDDKVINIPKPFEVGVGFTAPMEWLLDQLHDSDQKITAASIAFEISKGFLNNHQMLPSILQVPTEIWANKSWFTGRPIVPEWMDRSRMPKEQYTAYTTQMAKWMSEIIPLSPILIEHGISGWTGGMGLSMMRAVDGFRQRGSAPGSGFLRQTHRYSRYKSDFYKIHDRMGRGDLTPAMQAFKPQFNRLKKDIRDINQSVREGTMDPHLADVHVYQITKQLVDAYRAAGKQ